MLDIFSEFHLPTFALSLIFFMVVASVWAVIRTQIAKARMKKQVEKMDKSLQEFKDKLSSEDEKINELLKRIKSSKTP